MKSKTVMGLVSAGRVSQSFLTRLPSLQAHVGPIKANSFKSAKEMAKLFPGAYSVSHYSALEMCTLIWISLPEAQLDRVVRDMAAQMPVHRTIVVLCDCVRESSWPNSLAKSGARIATLNPVDGSKEKVFIGEGHPEALSLLKRLLWGDRRQLVQMESGAKPLYFAGLSAATNVMLPWVDSSVRFLRAAGFTRSDAVKVAETLISGRFRDYQNTGSKCWQESDEAELKRLLAEGIGKVIASDPRLMRSFTAGLRLALEHFGEERSSAVGAS